jgi:ribosomal protein S18 acetylase RimI-like enzyme
MPPKIRIFRADDEPAVVDLWNAVFPNDPPWNDPAEMIARKMAVQPELFFVCESDSVLVGTAMAGFDGVRGWVHKVATHPDYRRRGVARLLMLAAEQGLSAMGCTKLNLQVRDGNDPAASFYRELGYSVEERLSMSKHIGPSGRE